MASLVQIDAGDQLLLRRIDRTAHDAVRRSGDWVVCRPGCTQCCLGPFAITQLDARRLQAGMTALKASDPPRAARLVTRAAAYVAAIGNSYPGNAQTGELFDEDSLPDSFEDTPCPALDPETGLCELYEWRPVTCRTFGPAARIDDDTYATCELCYRDATSVQIAKCAVEFDPEGLEHRLVESLEAAGSRGLTIVACALTCR
jgi:Fe-S-cluster containining protein